MLQLELRSKPSSSSSSSKIFLRHGLGHPLIVVVGLSIPEFLKMVAKDDIFLVDEVVLYSTKGLPFSATMKYTPASA